jgi:hypothetical protein
MISRDSCKLLLENYQGCGVESVEEWELNDLDAPLPPVSPQIH